jgi:L-rhamnose mutarotase
MRMNTAAATTKSGPSWPACWVLKLRQGHELASLPGHPVMQRWWDTMADLMEVEPGNRPKEWPLTQVFHLA